MKSYRKELWFNIASRRGFKNITPDVEIVHYELNSPLVIFDLSCKIYLRPGAGEDGLEQIREGA